MIFHEINYKMPIFKNCTLGEMLMIGGAVLVTEILVLSLITKILFGFAAIGVAITLMSFFHLTKLCLTKLEKIKYGKPHSYYKHLLIKKLSEIGLIKEIYITRIGKWSVRRI